jgi:hypothetical protein
LLILMDDRENGRHKADQYKSAQGQVRRNTSLLRN